MNIASADDPIVMKTRELCQTIVQQPEFDSIKSRIAAFMGDEDAKSRYQSLSETGEYLQHKQEQGVELTEEEIQGYNAQRDQFLANDVAKGFLEAQDEMHVIQASVGKYINKMFELGRAPTPEEMADSGCGPSCGCH